jgi:predicted aspartyl protease
MYGKKKSHWKLKTFLVFLLVALVVVGMFKVFPSSYGAVKHDMVGYLGLEEKTTSEEDSTVLLIPKDTTHITKDNNVTKIPLEKSGNCYFLIANVNGFPIKFMLDTGCSGMHMSSAELFYLSHMDAIDVDSSSGKVDCIYADGQKHECYEYILKTVTIGDVTIDSIRCTVEETVTKRNKPLLGNDVLKRLGKVSIDYGDNVLIIRK